MEKKNKLKKKRWILFLICLAGMAAGLGMILFPIVSNWASEKKCQEAISSMNAVYDRYSSNGQARELLTEATFYNKKLAGLYQGNVKTYEEQLDLMGDGTIGYIEIPKISLKMVIYHGTTDEVLAVGVGHLEGSSLPVGGTDTHAVLTAHSGMKTMKAFDEIRKLQIGDVFSVTVLGKKLEYKVYEIETVLPYETESLKIEKNRDLVTLVTCTPYGINDHRLLVHAERVL